MKSNTINFNTCCVFTLLLILSTIGTGCKKAVNFKSELDDLPQISNVQQYQYFPAYGVGDTLVITGLLHPDNGLIITVGGVEAPIISKTQIPYSVQTSDNSGLLDQVGVVISREMGVGQDRPVTVGRGANIVQGAAIEIYERGGTAGSLSQPLKMVRHYTPDSRQNVYLNCVNGKGDIFYYGFNDKALHHIKTDGSVETLLTAEQLQTDQYGTYNISTFLAGGVNPQGTIAWISLQSTSDVRFCKIDLINHVVTTLNKTLISGGITVPYEGNIGDLKTSITGIYPDSKGNVYLLIGTGATVADAEFNAKAVALYHDDNRKLEYIFKTARASADMPGTRFNLSLESQGISIRINPEEAILYLFGNQTVTVNGVSTGLTGVQVFDLNTRIKIGQFLPSNPTRVYDRVIGPFSSVKIELDFNSSAGNFHAQAGANFGFLPLPGKRLAFMLYQNQHNLLTGALLTDFPKWLIIDFATDHLFELAPGTLDPGGYTFGPANGITNRIDQLINYDENGHLYMTSNLNAIVKTAFQ